MNNENLEVLEMEKNPEIVYETNEMNGNDMADDFFDDDLVDLDFDGLENDSQTENSFTVDIPKTIEPVVEETPEKQSFEEFEIVEPTTQEELAAEEEPIIGEEPVVEEEQIVESPEEEQEVEESKPSYKFIEPVTEEQTDKVEEVQTKENLDNSYVLSNFDVLFDSLYNDVVGANNLITDLIEKKSSLNKNEQLLEDFKEKFEAEKEEFRKFVEEQKKSIENEKNQAASFIDSKREHLRNEEQRFNEDSESKKKEIALLEQTLDLDREKFDTYKENIEEQNRIELSKIAAEREKLELEREQFEAEKKLSEEEIKNAQRDLQLQQEQFAKYKELEQKKMDLEEKNLSQSCARFKELVSQFNSGFEQLPNQEK